MDPNGAAYASYNYGGDHGYAAAVGDHSADHGNQFGWSQWDSSSYQNQQQQNQSHQQFQQYPKTFGQKSTFPAKNNQQQKRGQGFGYGGFPGLSSMSALGGGEWVQPPSQIYSQFKGGSFPKRGGPQGNAPWKNKNKGPNNEQKKLDTTGKTPAMILHELFKNVTEDYSEVEGPPKRYKCSLAINGQIFEMESPNKKTAKQKCSELVIRSLRPEVNFVPYEEIVVKTNPAAENSAQGQKRNASSMQFQQSSPAAQGNSGNVKKAKLTPLESALSLLDYFRKLADLSGIKYKPVFEASEQPKTEPMDNYDENEKKGTWRKNDVQHTVTLKFEEQNKSYTQTGSSRAVLKDLVMRDALRDLFNVTIDDIRTIVKRNAMARLGTDLGIVQTLQQLSTLMNCSFILEAEPAENMPIGVGNMFYVAKCKLVDNMENGKTFETVSPSLQSKVLAREYAAQEMLKNYFGLDPNSNVRSENLAQGPCAILHIMLTKKTKSKTTVNYEFKENVPEVAGQTNKGTVFYCDCVIDEKDRYSGSGRSKKLAKKNAAIVALKKIFQIDYDPSASYPLAMTKRNITEGRVSQLCRDVAEFSKREYHTMCQYFEVNASNQIACFFLVNEREEKRLISIGSSIQYVVEPDTLSGANGTALIHMDPIVIARRAVVRYFIEELQMLQEDPAKSVFVITTDGRAELKDNLKLILYANFPPVCSYSVDDAKNKRLAYVTPTSLAPAPEDTLSYEHIKATRALRIHCTADKMYKWSKIGLQGAMLSNLMHPVYLQNVFFGSEAPVGDESLKYALFGRLGDPEREIQLESIPTQMRIHTSFGHAWTRGFDAVEHLDYSTGRTLKGSPSKLCKAEIFEAFRRIPGVDDSYPKYADIKKKAKHYQEAKKKFYKELQSAGLGKWQTKPDNLVDDFQLTSFD